MEEYYNFLRQADQSLIDQWLKQVDETYYYGTSGLTDEQYDNCIRIYESRFGKRKVIGSTPSRNPVNLPIAMMSLDKIMTEKELNSYMAKNPGPYIVMDKINGNAALIGIRDRRTLYNRGDGTVGTNLSHMLDYLQLPTEMQDVYIKGELVINKDKYEPFAKEYKTNLSMINGLLNSQSADPEKLKLFDFIAYDLIFENSIESKESKEGKNLGNTKMSETLEELKYSGFTIPYYVERETLNIEEISKLFKQRKEQAPYDVDGLVICADREVSHAERCIRENPKHMVAFKEYGETREVKVREVVWEASKNCLIKPKIKIDPVEIGSFTISSLTAFNAGWIRDNKIGPGSRLIITHNTIPHILEVVRDEGKESKELIEASLPENPETWKWNETEVDIILLAENDTVKIAKIYEFFKQIGAKYWGETTIAKLYNGGFNNLKKILDSKKEDFLANKIDGIGEGMIDRMLNSLTTALESVNLATIMSASCEFGIGFGVRKIQAILDVYPDILWRDVKFENIIEIKGFAQKTAEKFIVGLPKFKIFLKEIKVLREKFERNTGAEHVKEVENSDITGPKPIKLSIKTNFVKTNEIISKSDTSKNSNTSNNLSGKSFVFTGFRDKVLEEFIASKGGKVTTGVSKSTAAVIVGGVKGTGSAKETKAKEYSIPIYSIEEFKNLYT